MSSGDPREEAQHEVKRFSQCLSSLRYDCCGAALHCFAYPPQQENTVLRATHGYGHGHWIVCMP